MRIKIRFPVTRALPSLAGAVCALCAALPALAQSVDCSTLSHPVYIAGSSAVKPFAKAIAKNLAAASPPISVVYAGPGSCVGVGYMTTPTPGSLTGTGIYWDTTGSADLSCNLTAITGNPVDIGVSDVFPTTCGSTYTLAPGVMDFHGPVQSMTFAVPVTSTQTSISVEAAYMVFGFGADTTADTVSPWTDPTAMEVRSATSGTQQMISAALAQVGSGFSAAKVKGVSNSGSGAVLTGLTGLAAANNQEKAIGFLAMDVVDANRSSVKPLAFQFLGQSCGYLPDSSPTTFDKQNTRDGHYAIWGPLHLLTPVGSDGKTPVNPDAATIISYLTGAVAPPFDLITVEATGGVVPDCAMRVSRTSDVGPMASYMPLHSCECKFLAAATGSSSCQTCPDPTGTVSTACTDPTKKVCNYGYCEVQ
jgi:ABC-type phosphate transport system substrate-binding protein